MRNTFDARYGLDWNDGELSAAGDKHMTIREEDFFGAGSVVQPTYDNEVGNAIPESDAEQHYEEDITDHTRYDTPGAKPPRIKLTQATEPITYQSTHEY